MDPITAAGLAAAVLSFVELGFKVFSQVAKIHDSSGGKTAKLVATDVVKSMNSIRNSRVLALMRGSEDWHNYKPLLDECIDISEEILKDLAKIEDGERRGRSRVASLRKIIASNRSDKHVEDLLKRLRLVRDQVILKLSLTFQGLSLESHEILKTLQSNTCRMMRQLDELQFERRPKELGYPWETGLPKDHIWVDDGLDPPFMVPLSLCSSRKVLLEVLGVKFNKEKLPGRFQIANGHIMIWNYEETQSLPMDDDCIAIPNSWRYLKLAFALATPWAWNMSTRSKKCIRCRKPQLHRGSGKFHTCKSCNLSFLEIDPTTFPGELRDIYGPLNDDYRDHLIASRSKQATTSPTNSTTAPTEHGSSAADEARESARRAKLRDDPDIELVCHRLVVKWEPLINVVHRYMYCRCILRKSSPASCEEEMTLLVSPFEALCPRHNNRGVMFRDYGDDDYRKDPYFDRFGGYDMFRFLVLRFSKEGAYSALGGANFISEEDCQREKDIYSGLPDEDQTYFVAAIMEHYFLEAWDKLDRMGVQLPPHAVVKLEEKRLQENEKHPDRIKSSISPEMRMDLYNSPMCREVREICAGTWSGKFHWAVESEV